MPDTGRDFCLSDYKNIGTVWHFLRTDFPSVEYRSVFIKDKEEPEHWAQLHMKEDTMDCM